MIDLIKQIEAEPSSYPDPPAGLSDAAVEVDTGAVWSRIESYIAYRFTAREVVWTLIAQDREQWAPPLAPVQSYVAHVWRDQWTEIAVAQGPLGLILPQEGTFKITAQVGAGPVPAPVLEAYARLAEYWAGARNDEYPGRTDVLMEVGDVRTSTRRWATWIARALDLSGAADLLRSYRRV